MLRPRTAAESPARLTPCSVGLVTYFVQGPGTVDKFTRAGLNAVGGAIVEHFASTPTAGRCGSDGCGILPRLREARRLAPAKRLGRRAFATRASARKVTADVIATQGLEVTQVVMSEGLPLAEGASLKRPTASPLEAIAKGLATPSIPQQEKRTCRASTAPRAISPGLQTRPRSRRTRARPAPPASRVHCWHPVMSTPSPQRGRAPTRAAATASA